MELKVIIEARVKFEQSMARGSSRSTCLKRWSTFIRKRDQEQCILCGSSTYISAHHICRKNFLPEAELQTGNGITLCRKCHKEMHAGFNGKPDLNHPMDSQGGEKIEGLTCLYGDLLRSAINSGNLNDENYYLSDSVLTKYKMFQDIPITEAISGTRLEQAFTIWAQCPRGMMSALIDANRPNGGFSENELFVHIRY